MRTWRSTKPRSSNKIFSIVLPVLGIAIAAGSFFVSREFEVRQTVSSFFGRTTLTVEKIHEGIAMLKASPPLEYTEGGRQQVALAIFNTTTHAFSEQRIWITPDGTLLKNDGPLPIELRWFNGFNSVYAIPGHADLMVVANKYLVERQYLPEQRTLQLDAGAPRSRYTDMVYAPYSEQLRRPDVIAAGKSYVKERATLALKELKDNRVPSAAVPGKLVIDVIPHDLVENIVLTEQVDPGWLSLAEDGGKALAERTLVLIGANREWAYRYTNSSAGARGLAQFIEPTYDGIAEHYPEAKLIRDHRLGMADHVNAFKAIALFFDLHTAELQRKIQRDDIPISKSMLAAAYNGGPSRVIRAVNTLGPNWEQSAIFPDETSDYIKKYHLIEQLKIF